MSSGHANQDNARSPSRSFNYQKIMGKTSDKKLNDKMQKTFFKQKIRKQAINSLNKYTANPVSELVPEAHEHLLQFRQDHLKPLLSVRNNIQCYDLSLDFGNYKLDYTKDGRDMILASDKGHVAILEWKKKSLKAELHLNQAVFDCQFIHDGFFALAQKQNVFIYENQGLEVHQLDNIQEPRHLEYLPYHYLLASLTERGKLVYTDVSTGQTAAEIKTKIQKVI
jgi:U3 small nucleolar RNA-associated protein 7